MHYWVGLPSIVFGAASLLAGIATFFVPDTADTSLPDTVKQAEQLGSSLKEEATDKENKIFVPPLENKGTKL